MFLLSFAAEWPVNIAKSLRSRTAKDKSVAFEIIVLVGYLFAIAAKLAADHFSYVTFFYFINLALLAVDITLYFSNARLEKLANAQV